MDPVADEPVADRGAGGWRGTGWRERLVMLAELTALWGFAFVQPVLDVFGRSPEQFVFRRADGAAVIVFAVGV